MDCEGTRIFGRRSVVGAVEEEGAPAAAGEATGTLAADGGSEAAPGGAGPDFVPAREKYALEARIGSGGMGEVLLVADRDLRRTVAMKVMRPELSGSREHRLQFVAEAQATSQLEHPGIPPVHDIGLSPDGAVYFTMKLVRGRNLREVLKDLLVGRREARQEFTLHRLMTVLERVAEAVHFAHEKGVIHRDLKPENIMLGDFGEVHVMDWGIAKVMGVDDRIPEDDRVRTDGTETGTHTLDGVVKGTMPYMSPEQAAGRNSDLDRRSDVYALGCVLYEMLSLYPAFEGPGVLAKVRRGEFAPVEGRNPRREMPHALVAACARAMARDPAARHATAREFAGDLRDWLDGTSERERLHREAETLAARGKEAARRHEALRAEAARAEEEAAAQAERFAPWASVAEKRPLLAARERVLVLRRECVTAFHEATLLLEGAILAEEANATARAALAEAWRGRLLEAEARGDAEEAVASLAMIQRYDDGRHAALVAGDGALSLETDPPGAEVLLHRFVAREGVLAAAEPRPLGRTPLGPLPLPMGSYLAVLRAPGLAEVRYPVHVTRNREWAGRVRLPRAGDVPEGFVFVPGGPFVLGEGKAARTLEAGDFCIARYPVTFAEYGEFLAALEEERGADAAMERLPRTPGDGPCMERAGRGDYRTLENNCEGPTRDRCLAQHGPWFEGKLAVVGVTFDDALAYCAWRSRLTGRRWRLPTEEEREKAARGVDGRRFPWGDLEDASLGKCRSSTAEHPQPEPVGAYPASESVYGMGDAAGGTFDWTASWHDPRETLRVLRGGSWVSEAGILRCAYRFWLEPGGRLGIAGFRCVVDVKDLAPASGSRRPGPA